MARKRAAGNADGTPRLELAEGDASDEEIIAAIEAAQAEEGRTEADGETTIFPEASRFPQADGPDILTEQAPQVEGPRPTYYDKKKVAKQAQETAVWLVMILQGAAVMSFGEDATLLPNEKRMITEPMARMMARMDPAKLELVQRWTDPILLMFGIGTWGMRLYAIAQDRAEGDDGSNHRPPPETPPVGPSGRTVEEVIEEDPNSVLRAGPPASILEQVQGMEGNS